MKKAPVNPVTPDKFSKRFMKRSLILRIAQPVALSLGMIGVLGGGGALILQEAPPSLLKSVFCTPASQSSAPVTGSANAASGPNGNNSQPCVSCGEAAQRHALTAYHKRRINSVMALSFGVVLLGLGAALWAGNGGRQ